MILLLVSSSCFAEEVTVNAGTQIRVIDQSLRPTELIIQAAEKLDVKPIELENTFTGKLIILSAYSDSTFGKMIYHIIFSILFFTISLLAILRFDYVSRVQTIIYADKPHWLTRQLVVKERIFNQFYEPAISLIAMGIVTMISLLVALNY